MLKKLLTNKKIKLYYLLIVGLFGFSSYFMASLTFQYIGNNAINSQLIIGFVFGLLSPLLLGISSYGLFWKKLDYHWQIVLIITTILALIFAIISFIFGTIGYLQVT